MKLYTEEQVKKAISFFTSNDVIKDKILTTLTPIELPSDEEIKERSLEGDDITGAESYELGAKWVIEQIKQQDNDNRN